MNIRIVVLNHWPTGFETDTAVSKYVVDNANNIDELEKIGLIVEDMTVPNDIDNQHITYLATGFAFTEWFDYGVDIHKDYYQNWVFIEKNGKYGKK